MNMRRLVAVLAAAILAVGLSGGALAATPTNYGAVTLTSSGAIDSGHFADIWDLTTGDMTLSFTYDGNGLVDTAGAHAWAELGVRTAEPGAADFNPSWSGSVYGPYSATVDLLADQNIDIGSVTVTSDATYLYVTYHLDAGWCMTQSHFAVATTSAALPQKKGNAIPGKFPYGASYSPCATGDVALDPIQLTGITGWTPGATLYFAAHAAVNKIETRSVLPTVTWTRSAEPATANYPGYGAQWDKADAFAIPLTNPVIWDSGTYHAYSGPGTAPEFASWLYGVTDPIGGSYAEASDLRRFQASFEIPDECTITGVSMYTGDTPGIPINDNLYIFVNSGDLAYWGGTRVDAIGATFMGVAGQQAIRTTPVSQAYETDGWYIPGDFPELTGFVSGTNVIDIFTEENERWGGMGKPTIELDCTYIADTETAWGDGEDFPGKNWATYFSITPTQTDVTGSGVWLATDYDGTVGTFGPDVAPNACWPTVSAEPYPAGYPSCLDLDDALGLQRVGGHGAGDYNLPSVPSVPGNNHRFWWDRDGVDPWQNGETANTGGIYDVVITLHATDATHGTAYMTVNGLAQGFETDGNWNTIELTPAGMTFTGDMTNLQVFYGLYGYGATHSVTFSDITVTQ